MARVGGNEPDLRFVAPTAAGRWNPHEPGVPGRADPAVFQWPASGL